MSEVLNRLVARRRELFFAAGFLFCITALSYSGYHRLAASAIARPVIACDTPLLDLGEVTSDQKVVCDFKIRNTGHQPLIVSDVKTGCGKCIEVLAFPRKPVLPGESSVIRVRLLTGDPGSTRVNGLTVCSNDPVAPRYVLRVSSRR
ncbi:MAG: DUF1573 domain-containing protein [Planctomycetota bacterium]